MCSVQLSHYKFPRYICMCKIHSYDVSVYAKCFDAYMSTAHQFTVLTDHAQHHGQHRPAHSVGVQRGTPLEKFTFSLLCKARKGEFWLVLYLHVLGHRFRLCGRLDTPGNTLIYFDIFGCQCKTMKGGSDQRYVYSHEVTGFTLITGLGCVVH